MGRIYETYVKRALDVALSGCALAVLSPVMGVTALLVRQKLGSPVIFHQDRPGKDEQIFRLYKFRTMTDAICRSSDRARCWSNTCRITLQRSAAAMPCAPD